MKNVITIALIALITLSIADTSIGKTNSGHFMNTGYDLITGYKGYKSLELDPSNISEENYKRSVAYTNFVKGICDILNEQKKICTNKYTYHQVSTVVGNWIEAHPKFWQHGAGPIVSAALQISFPCSQTE
jgi:hypothetical protein